ncbi:hypothetical protein ACVWXO_010885 [Bradyrhizobium sp. LM2.7]
MPRNALEAAQKPEKADYLTGAVVDYVNEIQRLGVYTGRELPAVAMQAYHADYYLAQVNNGGHSQFIGNTGVEMLPTTSGDALAGLKAMGASTQHQILQEMIAWVGEHPAQAALQNGFENRAAALNALDLRFYEAEEHQPMTRLAARWIASWPELRTVEQEQYASEIARLAQSRSPRHAGRWRLSQSSSSWFFQDSTWKWRGSNARPLASRRTRARGYASLKKRVDDSMNSPRAARQWVRGYRLWGLTQSGIFRESPSKTWRPKPSTCCCGSRVWIRPRRSRR